VKKYLLDTGIASDFINRRHGVPERFRAEVSRGHRIGIGTPVLAELVYGVEFSQNRDRNMQAIRLALPALTVWAFDQNAAFEYGQLAAELRRIGRPMQTVDVMIAAIALSLGNCTVVSADSDLAAVPGLTVENWAKGSRQ
jgi:tRNA(fMet)-specific endonuclease VapC